MLTHRGQGVAATGVALYGAGVALGYVELVVLGVGALLAVAVGFAWMVRRPAVDIRRSIDPDRVARGTPAHGTITFTNPGRLPSPAVVAVERWGDERFPIEAPRLAAGASDSTRYELPTGRRAAIDVGPIDLTREDPLGLWRTVRTAGDVRRLWVHPVALPLLGLPAGRQRDLEGSGGERVPQGSTTFHALREYVIGDDFRRIHWRSYARTGELMVREDVDASQPRITLLVDDRAAAYGGSDDFEEALDVAASVVVAAVGAGVPLRMVTVGGRAVAGGRHAHLDVLAELTLADEGALHPVAASLATDRRSDTLVAVTGLPAPGDLAALGALARRYDDAVLALVGERAAYESVPARIGANLLRGATATDVVARWNRALS